MRRVVYLGGRIANLTYEEATAARNEIKQKLAALGWDTLDPMRGKEILSSLSTMDEKKATELLGVTSTAIRQRDEDDVHRADVLLVLSGNTPSWGTAFEWEMAYGMKKPIVVICGKDSPTRDHPWCKIMTSYFAETSDEAVEFINKWLDRGYLLDAPAREDSIRDN